MDPKLPIKFLFFNKMLALLSLSHSQEHEKPRIYSHVQPHQKRPRRRAKTPITTSPSFLKQRPSRENPSRLTSRRAIAPDDDCCKGDQDRRARLKGMKKPPHRAVRRRVSRERRVATLEQDRRRRATSRVIQHSAANKIAVRSIGLSVHNPSGNAHPERQPGHGHGEIPAP